MLLIDILTYLCACLLNMCVSDARHDLQIGSFENLPFETADHDPCMFHVEHVNDHCDPIIV